MYTFKLRTRVPDDCTLVSGCMGARTLARLSINKILRAHTQESPNCTALM